MDVRPTGQRLEGPARREVDVGIGARVGVAGMAGVFRVDLGKGLRDGRTAMSFGYEP